MDSRDAYAEPTCGSNAEVNLHGSAALEVVMDISPVPARAWLVGPLIAGLILILGVFQTQVRADAVKDEIARNDLHGGLAEAVASQSKEPPDAATKPEDIHKLPSGTLVSDSNLPIAYGQFQILQTGTVPDPPPIAVIGTPASVDSWSAATVGQAPSEAQSLLREPTYMPQGWKLTNVIGQTATYSDGTRQALGVTLNYERSGYFPIRVSRGPITDQPFDVINPSPESKHALTLADVAGVKAVMTHQAPGQQIQAKMQILFIEGDTYTSVWWPAGDFDELERIAGTLILPQQGSAR